MGITVKAKALDLLTEIPYGDWVRISFVFCHVIFCAFAITTVLKADYKILVSDFCQEDVARDARQISLLLGGLWITGLAIIYVDTGFSPGILMAKGKLILKLMCVLMLTLNGMILHHISFPVLTRSHLDVSHSDLVLLSVTGALSTSHWLLAAFIGLFSPLGSLTLDTLLRAYGALICCILAGSLMLIPVINFLKHRTSVKTRKTRLLAKCRLMMQIERSG